MKDEKKMDTERERERKQEHLCMIYPISNTYLDIKEKEQEREGRMDAKTQ